MHPITILSFGYLHGSEPEADIVEDLREKLRDPAHVPSGEMLDMTGLDDEVCDFVFKTPGAMDIVVDLVNRTRDKARSGAVTVAAGCAGGRHRSVAVARSLSEFLEALGYDVSVQHLHVHLPRVIHRQGVNRT